MEEDVEVAEEEEEDVFDVLDREREELAELIGRQPPGVLARFYGLMDLRARLRLERLAARGKERLVAAGVMVDYFRSAKRAVCRQFLLAVCVHCADIPMRLDSLLMSVAGSALVAEGSGHAGAEQNRASLSPPLEGHEKRPRIDHVGRYGAAAGLLLQRRWERAAKDVATEVRLDETWVSLRHGNPARPRDRPDRTATADRRDRTADPSEDQEAGGEDRVTLASLLEGPAGQVVVLLGRAGSGKTLLTSCLGGRWARGLLPSYSLLVLLEFRQLNLLTAPLSLADLLLRCFLRPQGGAAEADAVMDFVLDHPERTCWILDGYDEFRSRIVLGEEMERRDEEGPPPLDRRALLPVAELVAGLCRRRFLPGCTVLLTCRPRDAGDLEAGADRVAELLGFDRDGVRGYADKYFRVRGRGGEGGEAAVQVLLTDRRLVGLSRLPALCHICCVCLEHLLCAHGPPTGTPHSDTPQRHPIETQPQSSPWPQTPPHLPSTLTQVYLTVLWALLSPKPGSQTPPPPGPPDGPWTPPPLHLYRSEVAQLGRLAVLGLDENRILFLSDELPSDLQDLCYETRLLSRVELTLEDGSKGRGFTFGHLTLQEFLSALHVMTADDAGGQLKRRFNLRSRWTTRADPKTVFSDSLHLYVCGLAAPACAPALAQLTGRPGPGGGPGAGSRARSGSKSGSGSGGEGQDAVAWVKKRQAVVLKMLRNLAGTSLTGPKVVELYHCVQEIQDSGLAREVVEARPCVELRNIRLTSADMDAIAVVVASAGVAVGLDFGACSMELECLDVLPSCQHIHHLMFRSRKYDDRFAEKLSSILPRLPTLRTLEFTSANLTDAGAARITRALEECPHIADINFSDNSLTDSGIREVAEVLPRLPNLASASFGKNCCSLEGVLALLEKTTVCPNVRGVHVDGMKEIKVQFSQTPDMNSCSPGLTVSLLNQSMRQLQIQRLCELLARFPALSVLDLSGGQLEGDGVKTLVHFLQRRCVSQRLMLNDVSLSVDELLALTALLSQCPDVVQVDISRLQTPVRVSVQFAGRRQTHDPGENPEQQVAKKLRLARCGIRPVHLEHLSGSLAHCSDLTVLDLSCNYLGNKGLRKLLDLLPQLNSVQQIDVSENGVGMEGVILLAGALCSHRDLTDVCVSHGGKKTLVLKFHSGTRARPPGPTTPADLDQHKSLRVTHSAVLSADVSRLCRKVQQCPGSLEMDLSHGTMKDEAIQKLLKVLPQMTSLHMLNLSHTHMSTDGALLLVSCLISCQRVSAVELSPRGEASIRLDQNTEHTSCRITQYSLSCRNVAKLSGILEQCPRLSDLDLSSNLLRDEGVKSFVDSLPRLRIANYVSLNDNQLSQEGALYLVNAACSCDRVSSVEVSLAPEQRLLIRFEQDSLSGRTLSLRECSFEADHLSRLAEIVRGCPLLVKLELRHNGLGLQEVEDLVSQLRCGDTQRSISIEESWINAETAVSLLSSCLTGNRYIHTLRVDNSALHLTLEDHTDPPSTSRDCPDPASWLSTVIISLVDCSLAESDLMTLSRVLRRCVSLQELVLSWCCWGNEGAELLCSVLPALPRLRTLSLACKERCDDVVVILCEGLLENPAIQSLSLSGHVISDRGVEALVRTLRSLPALRSVDLSLCSGWTMTGGLELVRGLGQCLSLESISLDSVPLDDQMVSCLGRGLQRLLSLRRLNVNKVNIAMTLSAIPLLLGSLEGLTHLEEIELEGLRMGDVGVDELTRHLSSWTHLRKIRLSENCVSDQAGDRLLQTLVSCTQLQELHLSKNNLGVASASRMAQVLPSLTQLTVLDLSVNSLGAEGSASLSEALVSMKNLTKIHLASVGTSDLAGLAASLAHCVSVQDVSLAWNGCGDDVAMALAKVLPLSRKLQRLDLEANRISSVGAQALLRGLQSCPSLLLLRLWRNTISPSDAQRLQQKDKRLNFSPT